MKTKPVHIEDRAIRRGSLLIFSEGFFSSFFPSLFPTHNTHSSWQKVLMGFICGFVAWKPSKVRASSLLKKSSRRLGNRFPPWPKRWQRLTVFLCWKQLAFFVFFHMDTHVPGLRWVDLSKGSRVIIVGVFHMLQSQVYSVLFLYCVRLFRWRCIWRAWVLSRDVEMSGNIK